MGLFGWIVDDNVAFLVLALGSCLVCLATIPFLLRHFSTSHPLLVVLREDPSRIRSFRLEVLSRHGAASAYLYVTIDDGRPHPLFYPRPEEAERAAALLRSLAPAAQDLSDPPGSG